MRQICFAASLTLVFISIILLLNFTAPNPTGRRYSSEMPLLSGRSNDVGSSAEYILERDLGVWKNTVNFDGVIPDFITDFDVIEAKNCASLPCEGRGQFERLLALAHDTGRELWVYTRVNTVVPDEMALLVEETGGAIVPYFVVPAHVDFVDRIALFSGVGGGIVAGGMLGTRLYYARRRNLSWREAVADMNLQGNNRTVALIVLVIVVVAIVLNMGSVRAGLSTIQSLAATCFYLLGAAWFFRQLTR